MNLKPLKWPALALALTVTAFGGFHLWKDWRFDTDAPVADFPPPADLAEARRQDVRHLGLFFDHERSWTPATMAAAKAEYQRLEGTAESLDDAEFELAVTRVVALADNAHTKVREYSRTPRYSRVPVRGHWFADGYHVVRAYTGFESLLGHRWVAVEGVPMSEVMHELSQYIAGPEGTLRKYAPYLIESPELMHAAGITASPERMQVTLEDRRADTEEQYKAVVFEGPFPPASDQIARSHYLLTRQVFATSQPDWQSVATADPEGIPPYLDFPDNQMQVLELPDLGAFYLQFWTNSNVGDTRIGEFCEQALDTYREGPPRHLVVDQRFNGGGNLTLTRDCMEEFGRAVPADANLYIIIGGATFSAGIYSTAFLKQAAGDKAILVGEAVGDNLRHWAEDNLLRLPNSKIEIKFSTGMHDLTRPCRDWTRCHWSALFEDLAVDNLDPDIPAPLAFEDFASGRDPAMEAIRAHLGAN